MIPGPLAHRLALGTAVAVLLVIVSSAWLRHAQAGLGCADWPACYGVIARTPDALGSGVVVARVIHRVAATGALVAIVLLLFLGLVPAAAFAPQRRLAWIALGLALGLAALGIATPGARVPVVALGNLLGGFALFAVLCALAALLRGRAPRARAPALAACALVVTIIHAAIGGMIGAQFAVTACPPALAACPGADLASLFGSGALDPLRPLDLDAGRVRAPAGAAGLVVLHRLMAMAVLALALATAWRMRADRGIAAAIAVAAAAAAALGIGATLAQPAPVLTVGHNAGAALLVAALAAAAVRRSPRGVR